MGVEVPDVQLPQPLEQDARLGQVDQRPEQAPLVDAADPDGHPQGAGEGPRPRCRGPQDRRHQPQCPGVEHGSVSGPARRRSFSSTNSPS